MKAVRQFKMLAAMFAVIVMAAGAAFADELPRIAVYVTGDVRDNEKKALGTRMLASLINSGRYKGIERSNSFLMEIEKEQEKQRSGAIDDGQISELGRQFGVKFVCIADLTPAFGSYQVSARIVNVETAEVDFIGDASSPMKTMNDLTQVSNELVKKMFGETTAAAPRKTTGMSVGGGLFLAGDFGGGVSWASGARFAAPYTGGGAYLFFDAVYAEAFLGGFAGGGKWASAHNGSQPLPEDASRVCLNIGVFGKYPFDLGSVTAFPLLGLDYAAALSGKLKLANGGEYAFDAGALNEVWVKFGGGADFALGQSLYLRGELLYGVRLSNSFEIDEAARGAGGKPVTGHGLTFRAGAGVKF